MTFLLSLLLGILVGAKGVEGIISAIVSQQMPFTAKRMLDVNLTTSDRQFEILQCFFALSYFHICMTLTYCSL